MKLIVRETDKGIIYECTCCGKQYHHLPLCFGNEFPDYYFTIPHDEREARVEKTESLCVIDKQHFFHRGRLTIPIIDHQEDLHFNVWATIGEENFRKRNELWRNPARVNEAPYFGWLQTSVPTYGDTINLKIIAIENEVDCIPTMKVTEANHPLKFDQEAGITFHKALEIVAFVLSDSH